MSLVYITHHDENIFNVEKDLEVYKQQNRKYESKFKKNVRNDLTKMNMIDLGNGKKLLTSSTKCAHKTMGCAETPLNPPCDYLRKQHGIQWRRENDHECVKGRDMPAVPRYVRPKSEPAPVTEANAEPKTKKELHLHETLHCPHRRYFRGHKHRANFIALNIEHNKKAQSKRPPPRYVDTPKGDCHNLINAGLLPQYICSKRFGKVPCYLSAHKKMFDQCKKRTVVDVKAGSAAQGGLPMLQDKCQAYLGRGIRQMTQKERDEIISVGALELKDLVESAVQLWCLTRGLKVNFAEIFKTYQGLSLYTDTAAKKLRKGKLEKELRQLEQDIFLMESNPVIFVSEY